MLEFIGAMILLGFMVFLTFLFVKGVPDNVRKKDEDYQKERIKKELEDSTSSTPKETAE